EGRPSGTFTHEVLLDQLICAPPLPDCTSVPTRFPQPVATTWLLSWTEPADVAPASLMNVSALPLPTCTTCVVLVPLNDQVPPRRSMVQVVLLDQFTWNPSNVAARVPTRLPQPVATTWLTSWT